ncbi:hypothetical protein [Fusobacterium varium]|mgnify:FL=1|uniref:hypothetical protein n=1 Tax=Fusobacterium varium TaxID=856 RepID=UPI001F27AA88|nr:hypothetical protein [Fusobacterium varium]MCF0169109.1 hypothetical protein [Fusobacterium varium]MCF2672215.1 hypothetical protein [Fusobacterium varium]
MEEKILESVWGAIYLTVLILPLFYFAGSFIIITIDELKFTKILRVTKIKNLLCIFNYNSSKTIKNSIISFAFFLCMFFYLSICLRMRSYPYIAIIGFVWIVSKILYKVFSDIDRKTIQLILLVLLIMLIILGTGSSNTVEILKLFFESLKTIK